MPIVKYGNLKVLNCIFLLKNSQRLERNLWRNITVMRWLKCVLHFTKLDFQFSQHSTNACSLKPLICYLHLEQQRFLSQLCSTFIQPCVIQELKTGDHFFHALLPWGTAESGGTYKISKLIYNPVKWWFWSHVHEFYDAAHTFYIKAYEYCVKWLRSHYGYKER